ITALGIETDQYRRVGEIRTDVKTPPKLAGCGRGSSQKGAPWLRGRARSQGCDGLVNQPLRPCRLHRNSRVQNESSPCFRSYQTAPQGREKTPNGVGGLRAR